MGGTVGYKRSRVHVGRICHVNKTFITGKTGRGSGSGVSTSTWWQTNRNPQNRVNCVRVTSHLTRDITLNSDPNRSR